MPLKVRCPDCQRVMKAPDNARGKQSDVPNAGEPFAFLRPGCKLLKISNYISFTLPISKSHRTKRNLRATLRSRILAKSSAG